jgi:ribosome-associated toxin RatA of RatAB toxin-antitoxin module
MHTSGNLVTYHRSTMVIRKIQSFLSLMSRTTNIKKHTIRRTLTTLLAMVTIASIVITTIWQVPGATATSLEEIKVSREISAPIDQVWNIVSDVDSETQYWPTTKSIKNINKIDNNIVEREVTIRAGPQDAKTHQFVTLNPEQTLIQTNITKGPVTGSRVLMLNPSFEDNKTKVDVLWKVDMSGIPAIARGFAKDNFMKTTEEALSKIAQTVE